MQAVLGRPVAEGYLQVGRVAPPSRGADELELGSSVLQAAGVKTGWQQVVLVQVPELLVWVVEPPA